jgi:hypothetical protein
MVRDPKVKLANFLFIFCVNKEGSYCIVHLDYVQLEIKEVEHVIYGL